ncbi:peptidoglycan editing factor PgeF [Thermodesulfobacteriota bacterium]
MEIVNRNDILYIRASLPCYDALFLTRKGGKSQPPYDELNISYTCGDDGVTVRENFEKVLSTFSVDEKSLVRINQVHGDDVLIINRGAQKKENYGDYDAVVTNDPELCLSILTADCVPIFLSDKTKGVFAAVHAGWRGTAKGIVRKVIEIMVRDFSCEVKSISAAIGPAICEDCYEVKEDVLKKLLVSVDKDDIGLFKESQGRIYVDMKRINLIQLGDSGIARGMISCSEQCTFCSDDLFFSFRRENVTGRQLSLIRRSV